MILNLDLKKSQMPQNITHGCSLMLFLIAYKDMS